MTNILIVQGHPDPSEPHLCHAIATSYQTGAEQVGHTVQFIKIAEEDIPYLRSKTQWDNDELSQVAVNGQAKIAWANHVVIIYPLWMGDVPALAKAWIEQVMRQGFAFTKTPNGWTPALTGKSARIIATMAMPTLAYRWFYLTHSVRSLKRNVFRFCGFGPVRFTIIGNAEDTSGRAQARALDRALKLGKAAR